MKSDLSPINKIIKETVIRLRLEKKLKTGSVFNNWTKIVGKEIAKKAHPVALKNGHLVLKTENSTWSQELSFMDEELIEKINKFAGECIVKKIRFKAN